MFLPWAVPTFLAGLNWAWLFNPVIGPLPHWMVSLGILSAPNNILADPHLAMWGPIIANVWWGIPFFAITLLAALQAIPRDLYEAAEIDGANPLQRFTSITLPFLAPTIAITILLRTVWIANFADLIIVMTNGGPADRTQIVASYIFTQAFRRLDFGYASAIALVLLVLLLAYSHGDRAAAPAPDREGLTDDIKDIFHPCPSSGDPCLYRFCAVPAVLAA